MPSRCFRRATIAGRLPARGLHLALCPQTRPKIKLSNYPLRRHFKTAFTFVHQTHVYDNGYIDGFDKVNLELYLNRLRSEWRRIYQFAARAK